MCWNRSRYERETDRKRRERERESARAHGRWNCSRRALVTDWSTAKERPAFATYSRAQPWQNGGEEGRKCGEKKKKIQKEKEKNVQTHTLQHTHTHTHTVHTHPAASFSFLDSARNWRKGRWRNERKWEKTKMKTRPNEKFNNDVARLRTSCNLLSPLALSLRLPISSRSAPEQSRQWHRLRILQKKKIFLSLLFLFPSSVIFILHFHEKCHFHSHFRQISSDEASHKPIVRPSLHHGKPWIAHAAAIANR